MSNNYRNGDQKKAAYNIWYVPIPGTPLYEWVTGKGYRTSRFYSHTTGPIETRLQRLNNLYEKHKREISKAKLYDNQTGIEIETLK